MNMKKLLKWGGIALIVIIVIAAISGGNKGSSPSNDSKSSTQVEAQKIYAIGETIAAKNIEVTISSATEKTNVGGQFINEKPSEGATLVAVQWKYKNISDKPVNTFSFPSIKLLDANGTEYNSDLGKTSAYATEIKLDRKVLSDLNPGITVNDAQVFEVSKEAYSKGEWTIMIRVDGKSYSVKAK